MAQVVILGAGYAGVQAARALARLDRRHSVTLLDRLPYHQLITQLPAVAAGRLPARRAAIPLSRIIPARVRVLQTECLAVSPQTGEVRTSIGTLQADRVVLCAGSVASDLGIPGVLEHAVPLKSVADAIRVRDAVYQLRTTRPISRVVIVGGGYTGSELAGEITDLSFAPRGSGRLNVTIVQPDARLLPQASPKLAASVDRILRRRGIEMIFSEWVQRVERDGLVLESGASLPADLVVWAARTRPVAFTREVFSLTEDARIPVDPYLRSVEHLRIFVAGDLAGAVDLRDGTPFPASAQVAVPEGERAGENVVAEIEGRGMQEFRETVLGEALAFGHREGAADVAGVISTGRIALAVKRAALLRYLNKLGSADLLRDFL